MLGPHHDDLTCTLLRAAGPQGRGGVCQPSEPMRPKTQRPGWGGLPSRLWWQHRLWSRPVSVAWDHPAQGPGAQTPQPATSCSARQLPLRGGRAGALGLLCSAGWRSLQRAGHLLSTPTSPWRAKGVLRFPSPAATPHSRPQAQDSVPRALCWPSPGCCGQCRAEGPASETWLPAQAGPA